MHAQTAAQRRQYGGSASRTYDSHVDGDSDSDDDHCTPCHLVLYWRCLCCICKGTDTIPGKTAALYDGKKTKTYSDQANFVPFIVETGGRINAAGLQFLSRILAAVGGRGHGWTYAEAWTRCDVQHCAASHGHWRFNRSTCCRCLHSLPRRYTRLIVLCCSRYGGGGQ